MLALGFVFALFIITLVFAVPRLMDFDQLRKNFIKTSSSNMTSTNNNSNNNDDKTSGSENSPVEKQFAHDITSNQQFVSTLFDIIQNFSPDASEHKLSVDRSLDSCKLQDLALWDGNWDLLSEEALKGCIPSPNDAFYEKLSTLHSDFLNNLHELIQKDSQDVDHQGKSNGILENSFTEKQGILLIGGEVYTLFLLGVIRSIRLNSGISKIPIQIIFPQYSKETQYFCEKIIPQIDSENHKDAIHCDYMNDILSHDQLSHLKKYQYKPMALLMSRFQKTLYLDSDAYLAGSIHQWFDDELMEEKGFIMWPDYWRRVHHPKLYEFLDINQDIISEKNRTRVGFINFLPQQIMEKLPLHHDFTSSSLSGSLPFYGKSNDALSEQETRKAKKQMIPFHDYEGTIPDLSTESGILLFDKSKHLETLALALYYNYNGPHLYYTLLNQHLAGEGDKDTFILAATVLKTKYHQVMGPPQAHGYWCDKSEISVADVPEFQKDFHNDLMDLSEKWRFRGTTILQRDFIHDYKLQKWFEKQYLFNLEQDKKQYLKKHHNIDFSMEKEDKDKDIDLESEKDELSKKQDTKQYEHLLSDFYQQKANEFDMQYYIELFKLQTHFPVFHFNLPKFDPYVYAKEEDGMYDGAKFKGREMGRAAKHLEDKKGHFRMLGMEFLQTIGNYDIELSNFKIYKDLFCSYGWNKDKTDEKSINRINYLKEKFMEKPAEETSSENKKEDFITMDKMCVYINDRYDYLMNTTWEDSIY